MKKSNKGLVISLIITGILNAMVAFSLLVVVFLLVSLFINKPMDSIGWGYVLTAFFFGAILKPFNKKL